MQEGFVKILIENLGKYVDSYIQSDTLLLVDVFKNFRNIGLYTWLDTSWIRQTITLKKKKKLIELMKDEFGGKNHEKICWIKSKNL